MKKTLLSLFLLLFLLAGCADNNTPALDTPTLRDTQSGKIETVQPLTHDFGEIGIMDGKVSQDFVFTNTDSAPLYIHQATTSCGCTQGTIKTKDQSYGPFGMHQKLSQPIEIPANSTFTTTVTYDPLFHGPNDLGRKQRTLFLFSSSQLNGNTVRPYTGKPNFTEINIVANVVQN